MNFYYIRLFWLGVLITGKSKVNDDLEFKNIFVPKKHKLYNHDVDPNIKIYF